MPPTLRERLATTCLVLVGLGLTARAVDQPPTPTNSATAPEARHGAWEKQHEAFVSRASRGDVGLLFLGDSITAGWLTTAPTIWARSYVPRKAVNFGIGGDHVQHLLWRVDHGELDGIEPKVVVLMAGINNVPKNTEDQVAEGVTALVRRIRTKLPRSKIVLMGILPRGASLEPAQPRATPDPRVARVNARLAQLEDHDKIRYLDIGPLLLDPEGTISKEIQPDFLHLSRKGYQIWADTLEPLLWEMMGDGS